MMPEEHDDPRGRALKTAEAYIAEVVPATPPQNSRGYPIYGWRQTPPAERLALVLKTARFLLGEEDDTA